ncbi:hypothetical protein [Paraliobacillus ryukyuensis]|uniref:hypothetical protein n=1 Tax=Paraliobacillus ryukyuensis TaxID=200904 RepID=UPI0009A66EEB|nr:hypothetical protein [Paraliobacillus ryukyuensis]
MEKNLGERSSIQRFWFLIAENDLFDMVKKSGFGLDEFYQFQRKRFVRSILSSLVAIIPSILISPWFGFSAVLFFMYTWRYVYKQEKYEFNKDVFEKQINWQVFKKMFRNYIRNDNPSIVAVLKKMLERLKESHFKDHLNKFIIDITEHPENVKPYVDFSKNAAGGTNESLTFMLNLYNYQNYPGDSSVVDELLNDTRDEMMEGIKDIRSIKERWFYFVPTKLTMLQTILLFGYMAGATINLVVDKLNF